MNEFTHSKTGWKIVIHELTQKMLEDYVAAFKELEPEKPSGSQSRGAAVRAAIRANWIESFNVDNANPAMIGWMAGKIDTAYLEAITIPPE